MIESLIDGERRGAVLADLALGRMRSKIPDLSMAPEGRFGDHHEMLCRLHLDHLDHLDGMIVKLDAQIEKMMRPFRARDLLITIRASGRCPPRRTSPRSARTSGPTSPTRRTWPPGPGSAPATTNQPTSTAPGNGARETGTSSPSWWSAPGAPSATTGT